MLAILLPCGGGPEIPILSPTVVLGRHPDCDVPLPYRFISGRHCELERINGYWQVRDLGSSNGTKVNGITVTVSWLLPDDELTLGKERFYLIYIAPEGERPPPPRASGLEIARKPQRPTPAAVKRTTARAWTLGELVPCGGGESIPLLKTVATVGRSAGCDVVINAADVSGRHCQLELTQGYWFVRDLGSHNGTRVNNERCTRPTLVPPEGVLAVGRHRYRLVYTPEDAKGSDEDPFARGLLEKAGLEEWQPDPEDDTGTENQPPNKPR
jgi:adenylate cyclase